MQKHYGTFCFIIACLSSLWVWAKWPKPTLISTNRLSSPPPANEISDSKNLETKTKGSAIEVTDESEADPTRLWEKLENTSFDLVLEDKNHAQSLANVIEEGQREEVFHPTLREFHESWKEACAQFRTHNQQREQGNLTAKAWRELTHQCLTRGLAYQKILRGKSQIKNPLEEETDTEKLKERLLYEFQMGQWEAAANTAQRWSELNDEDANAKWARLTALTQWVASYAITESKNPNVWQRVDKSLRAIPDNEGSLPHRLYLSYLRRLNPNDLLNSASWQHERYPQSPVPLKFLAIAYWELGHKEKSLFSWRQYTDRLSPFHQAEAQATLSRMENNTRHPFQLRLSLDTVLLNASVPLEDH